VCTDIVYAGDTFSATSEYLDFPGGTIDHVFWCGSAVGIYDVWYKYRPSANGILFVHVEDPNGIGLEWVFGIYDDCPAGEANLLDCNVFQHHGTIVLEVEQGRDYLIRIAARDFERGTFLMNLVGPDCVLTGNDLNANGILDDCECPWDVNNDGTVGWPDFWQIVGMIGQDCVGCPEDVDSDGDVDPVDAQSVIPHFGDCPENVACMPGGGPPQMCASGVPDDCYCFTRFDGQGGLCVQDFPCGTALACPTGDCPPGFVCVTDTACGSVCAPLLGCDGNPNGLPGFAVMGDPAPTTGLMASGRYVKP
jgi:hypothetical protein